MNDDTREVQRRLRELEADPALREHPLLGELQWLARRYFKVERQLRKVSRIGDLLQALLHETSATFQQASLTDSLTGLPNRRAMIAQLLREANRAERDGSVVSIAMGDVDAFKTINDTFGHDAGDAVLQDVGRCLLASLRDYDHCARWGGEEFMMLLPGETGVSALDAAERLRYAVAAHAVEWRAEPIKVTMSFGVAEWQSAEDIESLVGRADVALYEAKHRGRNRGILAA